MKIFLTVGLSWIFLQIISNRLHFYNQNKGTTKFNMPGMLIGFSFEVVVLVLTVYNIWI